MIELSQAFLDSMLAHSREALPNEACGVLAGPSGRAVAVYPIRNVDRRPNAFRFHPGEQRRVFQEVRSKGWDLIAFFHSHPGTEALPSPTDRKHAFARDPWSGELVPAYPRTRSLIISLRDSAPEIRAFSYDRGMPVEEEVLVT